MLVKLDHFAIYRGKRFKKSFETTRELTPQRKTNSWNLKLIPLKRKLIFQTTIIFGLQNVNKFQVYHPRQHHNHHNIITTNLYFSYHGLFGVSINSRGSVSSHPQVSPQLLRLDVELCPTLAGCFNPGTNIFAEKMDGPLVEDDSFP